MRGVLLALLLFAPALASAAGIPAVSVVTNPQGGQEYSLTIQVLLVMTALTLLPSIVLTMTSFTRIVIVLGLLRHALGTGQTPSNQILVGLALMMTLFVMSPVLNTVYDGALQPYLNDEMPAQEAIQAAAAPLRQFMMAQTRDSSLLSFATMAGAENGYASEDEVPMSVLLPAFITSELTTAFQMGFLLFIPFVIIDMVIASTLMSMGMMMLSPMLISLPFKVMLFVLVDGWTLVTGSIVASFG